jgi:two-component system phosphate regulon sensor histidine kinase PhoR
MKTGAETILEGNSSKEDYQKLAKDSLEEINFLSSMVDDLLFLAGNDDLKKVEFEKLDLGKLVRQQINLMETFAKKKGVSMLEEIKGEFFISGNKTHIKRLVTNLLKNAIDYNNPNGNVNVFINKNKQFIELKIVDTGIGIAQKDLPNIFDRFYKVDQARTKHSGGAGLGLSIVKEITELHRAKISIISQLSKGTAVTILFPIS